jgi:hypothetical protein
MLSNEQRRRLEQDWELDFSYGIQGLSRFRANFYKDKGNYAAAFRVIESIVPSFDKLGLPEIVRKTAENVDGAISNVNASYFTPVINTNDKFEEVEDQLADINASLAKQIRDEIDSTNTKGRRKKRRKKWKQIIGSWWIRNSSCGRGILFT